MFARWFQRKLCQYSFTSKYKRMKIFFIYFKLIKNVDHYLESSYNVKSIFDSHFVIYHLSEIKTTIFKPWVWEKNRGKLKVLDKSLQEIVISEPIFLILNVSILYLLWNTFLLGYIYLKYFRTLDLIRYFPSPKYDDKNIFHHKQVAVCCAG